MDAKNPREAGGIAQRAHRRNAEVAAFLGAQLLHGETVLAVQRGGVMVTDRRVLFPWPGYLSGWHSDAVAFEEVTRWSLGHRHDGRPLLRLEHPIHLRTELVAAHHFLWFAWGNAEAQVPHDEITLAFGTERDEAFRATINRLQHIDTPRGGDFVVMLPGTRDERTQGSKAALYRDDGPDPVSTRPARRFRSALLRKSAILRIRRSGWG